MGKWANKMTSVYNSTEEIRICKFYLSTLNQSTILTYNSILALCPCVFGLAGVILEILCWNFVFSHTYYTTNLPLNVKILV